tara:strand:+ start:226 stop:1092 length:867 start_codon:yes stop_codon:yes gene_type:complete
MNKLKGLPPIFYLNLDYREDRKNHIESQFRKWDITDYTRWSASTFDSKKIDEWGHRLDMRLLAPSDASILMNEFTLLIEWYNSGISEYCMVVQDDLCFDLVEYWPFTWQEVVKALPYNWDIVQFYYCHDWHLNMHLHPRKWHSSSAACFMVNRFFVEKLINIHLQDGVMTLSDHSIKCNQSLRDLQVPIESYSSDDFLLYQIGKAYTLPLLTLDPKLAVAQDNKQTSDADEYNPIIAAYHNKIYDILSTSCIKKWWEQSSQNFTADDILSWGGEVHKKMEMKLPQYNF